MKMHTEVSENIEDTKGMVYQYLYANGMYPVDEEYTTFESYARGSSFGHPRRWKLKVILKYHSLDEKTGLDIIFDFRSYFTLMHFSSHDKQYYRAFMEHFVRAIQRNDVSVYHPEEMRHFHLSLTQWMYYLYYTFIVASIVVVPSLEFLWEGRAKFLLFGLFILLFSFNLFKHIRFRQQTLRL